LLKIWLKALILHSPDVIMLQKHWLTPANLHLLDDNILTHYAFGKSAMSDLVTQGPLFGRPFGGVSILIRNELRTVTECVFCDDRQAVVRVGNLLIVHVYQCKKPFDLLLSVRVMTDDR